MEWLFPSLREKMTTIIPIATRGKCTSVEVPFVPANITPNALHTEAYWWMLLYLFALVQPPVLPPEIIENETCR